MHRYKQEMTDYHQNLAKKWRVLIPATLLPEQQDESLMVLSAATPTITSADSVQYTSSLTNKSSRGGKQCHGFFLCSKRGTWAFKLHGRHLGISKVATWYAQQRSTTTSKKLVQPPRAWRPAMTRPLVPTACRSFWSACWCYVWFPLFFRAINLLTSLYISFGKGAALVATCTVWRRGVVLLGINQQAVTHHISFSTLAVYHLRAKRIQHWSSSCFSNNTNIKASSSSWWRQTSCTKQEWGTNFCIKILTQQP